VFTSTNQLTAGSGNASGAPQVYRFDAQTGQLLRVSVGENGFNDNGNLGTGAATIVPARSFADHFGTPRTDPTMSDDGSYVFFQSPIGLTPQALDDVPIDSFGDLAQNVYEWHDGEVSLISDGHDDTGEFENQCTQDERYPDFNTASSVCLLGTDPSGTNVFFQTADSLVAQDTDTQVDIYDARIGGGFAASSPVQCNGDKCQGLPGAPPAIPTAATVMFTGPGDSSGRVTPARVITRTVRGLRFSVRVSVWGPGRIRIAGHGVRGAATSATGLGAYKLALSLTSAEGKLLARRHRLRLRLRVWFTPTGGPGDSGAFWLTVKR
jgi:hypothetical protein